jgi:hypothetical protein
MDDWSASANAAAVPPTRAAHRPQPVTLTPARSFMDDKPPSITAVVDVSTSQLQAGGLERSHVAGLVLDVCDRSPGCPGTTRRRGPRSCLRLRLRSLGRGAGTIDNQRRQAMRHRTLAVLAALDSTAEALAVAPPANAAANAARSIGWRGHLGSAATSTRPTGSTCSRYRVLQHPRPSGGGVGRVAGVEHMSSGGSNFSFTFGQCQPRQG